MYYINETIVLAEAVQLLRPQVPLAFNPYSYSFGLRQDLHVFAVKVQNIEQQEINLRSF